MAQERIDQVPRDLAPAREAHGVADDTLFVVGYGKTYRLEKPEVRLTP